MPARHPDRRPPLAIARLSRRRLLSWPARAYLALFRNTPLLVQLFFWYFGVPALLPEALVSWLNTPHETPLLDWPSFEFLAGAWGLTLYTSLSSPRSSAPASPRYAPSSAPPASPWG